MKTLSFNPRMLVLAGIFLASLAFVGYAYANPGYQSSKASTAAATSTQNYLRSGNATTTVIYDSYEQNGTNQTNQGNITVPNSITLKLDGLASSTSSVINVACEYSDNYNATSTNGDWYQNELYGSTTTNPINVTQPNTYSFTFASSTMGGVGLSGSDNRYQKLIQCPLPMRYVRAVITNTGTNASVWAQFVPIKQRN